VLAAELLNITSGKVVDHVSPGHYPRAIKAKDVGSAVVARLVVPMG